jgi:hypothetical protein
MALPLPLDHLVRRVAPEMLSVVLYTVMRIAQFSTPKLRLASFNNNKVLDLGSYITIRWALLVELLLGWEGHFNSNNSSRMLWLDFSNFHLVDHPSRNIRFLEHLGWDKAASSLS